MATLERITKAPALYNDVSPTLTPGHLYGYIDPDLGFQEWIYSKMTDAVSVAYTLYKKVADKTNITIDEVGPNPTLELRDSGNFTANLYSGMLATIYTDIGGAGAAPEGESRRIKTNTTGALILDRPLSVAVAVNDVAHILNLGELAVAVATGNQLARDQLVGFAARALTANYWGLFLRKGRGRFLAGAGTVTKGKGLIMDATAANQGKLTVSASTSQAEIVLGHCVSIGSGAVQGLGDFDLDAFNGLDIKGST